MIWGGLAALVVGCSASEPEVSLRSDDPIGRTRALAAAVEARDRSQLGDVIGLLESKDPAMRMFAIEALEDLTGKSYGYEAFAPERERKASIERWRAALESGELSWSPGDPGDL